VGFVLTYDGYGAQTIPVQCDTNETVGDPSLGYIGKYLQAVLNDATGQAWSQNLCPNRNAVDFCFAHDPQLLFDESRLPALYVWRGKAAHSRKGDDLFLATTQIKIAWITESAQEEIAVSRSPMMTAMSNAIAVAINEDRDPAWILPSEVDPLALLKGTSISDVCGFSRFVPADSDPEEFVFQKIEDAQPLPYYGFVMTVEADEYYSPGNRTRKPTKLNATASTNGNAPNAIITQVP
jgi:hypothetical protein